MLLKKVVAGAVLLASVVSTGLAAELRTIDYIQPEYRAKAPGYLLSYSSVEEVRWDLANYVIPEYPGIATTTLKAGQVELTVYRPAGVAAEKQLPVVYFTHGGGFLRRNDYYNKPKYQQLADGAQVAIVTPKYRISTEAPFPAAVIDAFQGLQYLQAQGPKHGLDSSKIILMGDSAGGGLAAALALYNRDHGNIPVLGQILIYPMLDYRTGGKDSLYHAPNTGEVCWNRSTNVFAWEQLRGGQRIPNSMLPYYSPALAEDVSRLPQAFIYVGDLDLFVNEDIAYAGKLIEAGVPTELHVIQGLFHDFDGAVPEAQASKAFWQAVYGKIGRLLEQ